MKTRHTGIVVKDLEKSLIFYRDLLGLKVKSRAAEFGSYLDKLLNEKAVVVTTVKMSADNSTTLIELLEFNWPKTKNEKAPTMLKIGPTHIAFTVNNLDEIYNRLSAAGVPFICEPVISSDGKAKATFCKDPDGTLLELVEEL